MRKILLTCYALLVVLYVWAQERTITGSVTSTEDNSPLPGVNVLLKGTTIGTATDSDGKFSLSVPNSGGYLIFSFIGLESKEISIGERTVVDVSLALVYRDPVKIPFDEKKIPVSAGSIFYVFGDSFTVGQGATSAEKRWTNVFSSNSGLSIVNHALSGTASFRATKNLLNILPLKNGAKPYAVGWMASFNDVYRGGADLKTIYKIQGELRSFIANVLIEEVVFTNDPKIVATGNWESIDDDVSGQSNGATMRSLRTTKNGSTLEWKFSGTNVVIGCFNADNKASQVGIFEISIDGIVMEVYNGNGRADGISDGTFPNHLTHEARVFTDLGDSVHTLKITALDASINKPVLIDYFGILQSPFTAAPILIAETPRVNEKGYAHGPGVWSPDAMETVDQSINDVVFEFKSWPIGVIKINEFYNTENGISPDNEHPNDLGHFQIALAWLDAITIIQNQK